MPTDETVQVSPAVRCPVRRHQHPVDDRCGGGNAPYDEVLRKVIMGVSMSLVQVSITAAATMLAVLLGGWLTVRAQDRLWRRDHERQWRDIRLSTYTEFVGAFREYVAYVLQPEARISAVPRPREPGDPMPFFDENGSRYKERLESAKTVLRLVASRTTLVRASSSMVHQARVLAAGRATHGIDNLPSSQFDALWASEREFITQARAELGLTGAIEMGPHLAGERDGRSPAEVELPDDVRREDVSPDVGQTGTK
jgi:hypothetical protein